VAAVVGSGAAGGGCATAARVAAGATPKRKPQDPQNKFEVELM
jgi:hypothetical protein